MSGQTEISTAMKKIGNDHEILKRDINCRNILRSFAMTGHIGESTQKKVTSFRFGSVESIWLYETVTGFTSPDEKLEIPIRLLNMILPEILMLLLPYLDQHIATKQADISDTCAAIGKRVADGD